MFTISIFCLIANWHNIVMKPADVSTYKHAIVTASVKTGIPKHIIAAVAYKESKHDFTAVNKITLDYGALQINHRTLKSYGFNRTRLITDEVYSYVKGAEVLKYFLDRYGTVEGIKRFNCGTRKSCILKPSVISYFNDVERNLASDHDVRSLR